MLKLDLRDKKILWELDRDSRQSLSEIAKKVGLSKESVYYRIRNLESRKIITGYSALISLAKLGLMHVKLLIKFQNTNPQIKQNVVGYLTSHGNTNWVAECKGSYDLLAGFVVRDLPEFYKIKNEFFERYLPYVLRSSVSIMIEGYVYGRKYLIDAPFPEIKHYVGEREKIELDGLDFRILELLATNTRLKSIEIAKKLGTTPRTVIYRIKQLEKNDIIQKYTISINHGLLGVSFFKLFIYLRKNEKELLSYLAGQKNCVHNIKVVADWNLEPEFEVHSNEELYAILDGLEDLFGDSIKTIDPVLINKEHKFVLLPKIFTK